MLYTEASLPEEHKAHLYRERHLALALLALLGISVLPSAHRSLGALQAFSSLLSVPVLSVVCGRMSRSVERRGSSLRACAGGLAALYAGSALPGFWMMALARKQGIFDLLSPASAAGVLLFCAWAIPLAVWFEQKRFRKPWVLALSLVPGLFIGYLPGPANPLGLRQLLSFLPLFLLGRWVNPKALERLLKTLWLKAIGALALLTLLAGSFWRWKRLLDWQLMLMGGAPYASAGHMVGRLGALLRLVQYAAALAAALGLLSLCPNRSLGFVTRLSRRWYSGLFWHRGAAFLLSALPLLQGGTALSLVRTGLMGLMPLVCCLPQPAALPDRLLHLPQLLTQEHSGGRRENRRLARRRFMVYCLAVLLLLSQFCSAFVETGQSMVWTPDGECMYLVIMYYTRKYFVNVAKTLLRTHRLVLPQWDFSVGQGASVFAPMRLNPFYLLTFFFPVRWMDAVYALYILLQMFCSGLAFCALCRRLGQKNELAIFTGSLVYAFSGYSLYSASKHVYFVTYLVLALPLLLVGAERYLQDGKWGMFVAMVFLLCLGGFYYTWIVSLLMAIYLLAREITFHKLDLRKIFYDLARLVALYLWGMALSMVVLLPYLMMLFTSSRSGTLGNGTSFFYESADYKGMLVGLVNISPASKSWTRLSFVGTVFLALVVLFLRRGRRELRVFRVLTGLSVLSLCLPVVGSVFNGMGYATNRWCFGFALLMALIFVWMLPEMVRLSGKEQGIVGALTLSYCALVLVLNHNRTTVSSMLLLLLLTLVLLLVNHLPDKALGQRLLSVATVAALMVHIGYYFSPNGMNEVKAYTKWGVNSAKLRSSAEAALTGLEEELYRGECASNRENIFCLTGGNGTSTYWGMLDGTMVDYHLDFELDSLRQLYAIWSLDQRASLYALGGVKYYTAKSAEQAPFGFREWGKSAKGKYVLYRNQYALPFGCTYTSYLPREAYDKLSPLEKQQAILQSAVVEEVTPALSSTLAEGKPTLNVLPVNWEVSSAEGVELKDNTFRVTKNNASIRLSFQGVPGCETYLWLRGARCVRGDLEPTVRARGNQSSKRSDFYLKESIHYFDRGGFTYNLGYSDEALTECTITFDQRGVYTADDIQIVCLPMADYVRDVTALGEVVLENARETPSGGLSGHIALSDTRLLALSVPWSTGWKLFLNGEESPLMRLNGMYMGALLGPGSYDVELRYTMPGLRPGAVVSALALLPLLAHVVLSRIRGVAGRGTGGKETRKGAR